MNQNNDESKKRLRLFLILAGLFSSSVNIGLGVSALSTSLQIAKNESKYESQIEEYDRINKEYAKKFEKGEWNKTRIIAQVIEDMWYEIEASKEPVIDAIGFRELDMVGKNAGGVCRNMAPHIAKRLNAIDPSFNARTLLVTAGSEIYWVPDISRYCDIDGQICYVPPNEDIRGRQSEYFEESDEESDKEESKFQIKGPNHVIVLVDMPEDNIILGVDPSLLGFGIYYRGRIILFNTGYTKDIIDYSTSEIATITDENGIESAPQVIKDYFDSFKKPENFDYEKLRRKYGEEAINKELEALEEQEEAYQKYLDKMEEVYGTQMAIGIEDILRALEKNGYGHLINPTEDDAKTQLINRDVYTYPTEGEFNYFY